MGKRRQTSNKTQVNSSNPIFLKSKDTCKITFSSNDSTDGIRENCDSLSLSSPDANIHVNSDKVKSETNAFKLMMDSRNKSIGSNSPGKAQNVEENEDQDLIDKKSLKAKRKLLLQKMSEEKGSLKKKEIEDLKDIIIKKKMAKRAARLKKLILKGGNGHTSKAKEKCIDDTPILRDLTTNTSVPQNSLNYVDLFENTESYAKSNSAKKTISKEENEFLKKLSPSLKKKENMLCYFTKLEKVDSCIEDGNSDDNKIIKVKLTSKISKKKKLSLNKKDECADFNNSCNITVGNSKPKICDEIKFQIDKGETFSKNNNNEINKRILSSFSGISEKDSVRPKRNIKRPAKYIEEEKLTSSDEELHIISPKKKKRECSKIKLEIKLKGKNKCNSVNPRTEIKDPPKKKDTKKLSQKVTSKLAPIFNANPRLDAEAKEAKQKFLNSGIPDKIKMVIEKKKQNIVLSSGFSPVVHIQQLKHVANIYNNEKSFCLKDETSDEDCETIVEKEFLKLVITQDHHKNKKYTLNVPLSQTKTHEVLQYIKESHPKFPVYRTYRLLRDKSKGEFRDISLFDLDNSIEVINGIIDVNVDSPESLNWTDKYKPMASQQILGNFVTTKELKKWLISWTENDIKAKKKHRSDSDSSDFYQSDTDSKDSIKNSNNLFILTGPVGSGKTAMVYAVAAELSIKVLEVNASSKRTGKIMLQDLQEATQSHKVNRSKTSSQELSQKEQINEMIVKNKSKKRGRPKKIELASKSQKGSVELISSQPQSSQDSGRTCMSLVLIDDADIVFEQDDGFCSAIVQLVQCSKRPVILITSSTSCPHLQRFVNTAKVMHTRSLLPGMLGTWLDIMCLAENNSCWPGLGAQFLDYFKGDIRKTINYLQYYLLKEPKNDEEIYSQNGDYYEIKIEDECSNMSWSDRECKEEKNLNIVNKKYDYIWGLFIDKQVNLFEYRYPFKLFTLWWNVPALLCSPFHDGDSFIGNKTKEHQQRICFELEAISNVLDMISLSDYLREPHSDSEFDLTSPSWRNADIDSVSEQDNLQYYNKSSEVLDEICHSLVTKCIAHSQMIQELGSNFKFRYPTMSAKRERDRTTSRHDNLTNYLNQSAVLDRRALALDYWSGCRTICRLEKNKTDSNSKRNNRFCHYLKSLNVLCNNEFFENLGNSLCQE